MTIETKMLVSIIIRTYNEEIYLSELLEAIRAQQCAFEVEVVLVDSGSTDRTLEIAEQFHSEIVRIAKSDFTFGRSLNVGCTAANGEILVFISGHCVPVGLNWLEQLCQPIIRGQIEYSYGRQVGRDSTKFSEEQHFKKFFPNYSKLPQEGFFVITQMQRYIKHLGKSISSMRI